MDSSSSPDVFAMSDTDWANPSQAAQAASSSTPAAPAAASTAATPEESQGPRIQEQTQSSECTVQTDPTAVNDTGREGDAFPTNVDHSAPSSLPTRGRTLHRDYNPDHEVSSKGLSRKADAYPTRPKQNTRSSSPCVAVSDTHLTLPTKA